MLTGSNLTHTREYNRRIVHEVIRLHGPVSRAEIARHTALTGQTVSNLVKELLDLDLVREGAPRRDGGRGAPSTGLSVNPDGCFAVGLDFNRDHLTGVLVDLGGTVRERLELELDLPTPPEAVELMATMVDDLLARQGGSKEKTCGVGVGIPGPMYLADGGDGYVVNPKSFPGWHKVPLAAQLRERLGLRVLLENNATAAAVGERWYGAGRHIGTFFYLFLGSGLGGALVMNGKAYEGHSGNAGEVGYLPNVLGGDPQASDESHVGLRFNLPRLYETLAADGVAARTPEDLDRLMAAGHPRLLQWVEEGARCLTGIVLAVEYIVDPEAILFGGRVPDAMLAAFRDRVAAALPGRRVAEKATSPHLLLGTAGADAAALGVATLPVYDYFAPAPQVLLKTRARRAAAR